MMKAILLNIYVQELALVKIDQFKLLSDMYMKAYNEKLSCDPG